MQVENDIFISYAHLDDESPVEGQRGWVSKLHRAMELSVAKHRGTRPSIWRDPKLPGNVPLRSKLAEKLAKVGVLVCVLSPSYVESDWCKWELDKFWQAARDRQAEQVNGSVRVFKVVKMPIPLKDHPAAVKELLGYEFYLIDPETGRPHELNPVVDLEAPYWKRLDDLAYDISELLKKLEGNGEMPPGPEKTVYLAATSSDLKEERDAVKRDLQRHGHRVLPDRQLPLVVADFEAFVQEQLARCQLSVHLVGRNYGFVPEGTTESAVTLQHDLALARQADDFARLIWLPPGLDSEDPRQQSFIERLQTDTGIHRGADLLEKSLEDFKAAIHHTLNPPEQARPDAQPPEESDLTRIYLICDQQDDEAIPPLEEYLWDQGVEVLPSLFDGDEAEVRLYHEESLRDCDAVLIYYGQGNELWLRRKISELRKSAYGRDKPMQAKAILVAPPANPRKQRFQTREALVIHQSDGFAPEALAPFLGQLAPGQGGPAP